MQIILLGLVSLSCFWRALLHGWSLPVVFQVFGLLSAGFLAARFYCRKKGSEKSALLAAAVFMVSVAPQANLPKFYIGVLPLALALLGLKHSSFKAGVKSLILFFFIAAHIVKYILPVPVLSYILPAAANFMFYFFAVPGVELILSPSWELIKKMSKKMKISAFSILPLFYFLLLYSYVENKQLFFFVSKVFNISGIALLAVSYLIYLVYQLLQDNQKIYSRLFIAAMLESLSVSFLL